MTFCTQQMRQNSPHYNTLSSYTSHQFIFSIISILTAVSCVLPILFSIIRIIA